MTVVRIRDVCPRDGLQVEVPVPVEGRLRLIGALAAAGVRSIEAAAFVSPRAVPAMAGAEEVMSALEEDQEGSGGGGGVNYAVLVPNLTGARRVGFCSEVTFTVSASPTYNERNVGMNIDRSLAEAIAAAELLAERQIPVDAVISCAFGSPYEGDLDPAAVDALGRRLLEGGVTSVTYADTTGMATPRRVEELLACTGTTIGLHLHDNRGTALVNAYAAYQCGVRRFDTAVGGLGGSPFATGASGNLATEDLVHLLHDLGVETGIDLDRLLAASTLAAELVGHPVPSRLAAAGPRSRLSET